MSNVLSLAKAQLLRPPKPRTQSSGRRLGTLASVFPLVNRWQDPFIKGDGAFGPPALTFCRGRSISIPQAQNLQWDTTVSFFFLEVSVTSKSLPTGCTLYRGVGRAGLQKMGCGSGCVNPLAQVWKRPNASKKKNVAAKDFPCCNVWVMRTEEWRPIRDAIVLPLKTLLWEGPQDCLEQIGRPF